MNRRRRRTPRAATRHARDQRPSEPHDAATRSRSHRLSGQRDEEGRMAKDLDRVETQEWLDALGWVVEFGGVGRASFLLDELVGAGLRSGASVPFTGCTPYVNSIAVDRQPVFPGDLGV